MRITPRSPLLLLVLLLSTGIPGTLQAQEQDTQQLQAEVTALRKTVQTLLERVEVLEAQKQGFADAPTNTPDQLAHPTTPPQPDSPVTGDTTSPAIATIKGTPALAVQTPSTPTTPSAADASTVDQLGLVRPILPARDTMNEGAQSGARLDNRPPPGDPELAGFFHLDGTDTYMRLGGYAKLDAMFDNDDAGDTDSLTTSAIPVGLQSGESSFNMHARQTRVHFEVRRPTSRGNLRFYLENDFFGDNGSHGYHLRQAYGQIGNTYAGYGDSVFMDPDAYADTLDFAGTGAAPFTRLPSVRQSFDLGGDRSISIAAEYLQPQVTAGIADADEPFRTTSKAPDLAMSFRQEGEHGHLQGAALVRRLAYASEAGRDTGIAGGAMLAGSRVISDRDLLVLGTVYGKGIAGYLGDLGGVGLDAVIEDDGRLQPLQQAGFWSGYTHYWSDNWRSNLVYGELYVDDNTQLPLDAYRSTRYAVANLIWSPAPSWTMGMEVSYGRLEEQDGDDGDVTRVQGTLKYDFIK